jgi:hypothetical protein
MRVKVTTHVRLGCKSLGCPVGLSCSGRNDLGGEQAVRPEHKEIAASSITSPRKVVFAETSEKADQISFLGRPKTLRKNQANALNGDSPGYGLRQRRTDSQK